MYYFLWVEHTYNQIIIRWLFYMVKLFINVYPCILSFDPYRTPIWYRRQILSLHLISKRLLNTYTIYSRLKWNRGQGRHGPCTHETYRKGKLLYKRVKILTWGHTPEYQDLISDLLEITFFLLVSGELLNKNTRIRNDYIRRVS